MFQLVFKYKLNSFPVISYLVCIVFYLLREHTEASKQSNKYLALFQFILDKNFSKSKIGPADSKTRNMELYHYKYSSFR